MLLSHAPTSFGGVGLGITASRKVGNAVVRNRLKRWGREFFRNLNAEDKELALDVNLVLRPQGAEFYKGLTHEEFDRALSRAWKKTKSEHSSQS
jgi:ribonuclease P protein component